MNVKITGDTTMNAQNRVATPYEINNLRKVKEIDSSIFRSNCVDSLETYC